ncbi:MAG: hypothetical protein UW73_C0003G0019 [Microgenomates group bacterium GW2011_GWB1_44_8]|nr:MAG: hypothetical protein UW73_C0003G0019 [Microgenomates group bacterium GW2011_GWB1_44_8]
MRFLSRLTLIITPPVAILLLIFFALYWDFFIKGMIPIPADALVATYYPWVDYKWGYITGVPIKNSVISDVFSQFFLWKYLIIEYLRQGILPLWNPYMFAGTPLLASYHSAALFPPNILLFVSKYAGWGLYISLSTLTAMASMYLFLGHHVKHKLARITGAVVFGLAGPMTTWAEFGTGVWAASFIPTILWCIDNFFAQKKKIFLLVITILSSFLFLAGHAQITTYFSLLFPAYVWWLYVRAKNRRCLIYLILFFLLGIGLAAIQFLPTLDVLDKSIRAQEDYASRFRFGLLPLSQIIRFWAADFFGNPSTHNTFGPIEYHEYSNFLGTISWPIILALIWLKKTSRTTKFFLVLFISSLFLAIDNPLSSFIFSLPLPLFTYSYASRLFFLTSLSAGYLVAIGLGHLENYSYKKNIAIVASTVVVVTLFALTRIDPVYRLVSIRNSILPLSLLGMLVVLTRLRLGRSLPVLLMALVIIFDLGRYFKKYNPFVPQSIVFPNTPITEFLKQQRGPFRISRQYGPVMPPNTWTHYRLEAVEGYDPLRLLSYNRFFHLAENGSFYNGSARFSELSDTDQKFLDLLNVKYFVSIKDPTDSEIKKFIDHGYKPIFKDGRTYIYENPSFIQRAFFVQNVKSVPDEKSLVAALEAEDFSPTTEAVLINEKLSAQRYLLKNSVVKITQKPNSLSVDLDTSTDGFLLISNAYDTGWKATIDGKDTPVVLVDGALQGLLVPANSRRVVLDYLPESVITGSIISLFSLGATVVFLKIIKV